MVDRANLLTKLRGVWFCRKPEAARVLFSRVQEPEQIRAPQNCVHHMEKATVEPPARNGPKNWGKIQWDVA